MGAPRRDFPGNDSGAAYLYQRDQGGTNNWGFRMELFSPSGLNNDQFGYSVSLQRDKLVVGLPFSGFDNQSKYGSAYAYGRNTGGADNWGVLQKLDRSDQMNNDQFGGAVAVGQDTVVVGASMADVRGNDSGALYIYRLKYNNPPRLITPVPDQMAITHEAFELVLSAAMFGDPDVADALTLTAGYSNGPLPAWPSFSNSVPAFSGTPVTPGTFTIRLTATDEDGATASDFFDIVVSGGANLAQSVLPLRLEIAGDARSGSLTILYLRPLNASSASYALQCSDDLASWQSAAALVMSETVTPLSAAIEQVALEVQVNLGETLRWFRLEKRPN